MKELECLKRIDTKNYLTEREHRDFYSVVEKSLKALEIIKKKNVDVDYFLFWCKQGVGKVEDYNQLLKHKNGRCQRLQLTEKEFNLLKEVSV